MRRVELDGVRAEPVAPAALSTADAARYLGGVSPRTLESWRLRGKGPAWVKVGDRVVYLVSDLDAFLASGRVTSGGVR